MKKGGISAKRISIDRILRLQAISYWNHFIFCNVPNHVGPGKDSRIANSQNRKQQTMNGEGHGHDINKGKTNPLWLCLFSSPRRPSPTKVRRVQFRQISLMLQWHAARSTANQQIEEEDIGAIHQWPNQHRNKVENRMV